MVLDDNYLTNLNQDSFEKVLTPKVAGAMNLHQLSRNLSLDFFIQFSSISALIGNVGQANYIVANGFLDALCHYRMRQNLPATSINWGVLGEVGVVANDSELSKLLQSSGINAVDMQTALNRLEKLLLAPSQHLGIFDIDWNQWAKSHPAMQKKSLFDELVNLSENTALNQASQHVEIKQLAGKERIQALAKSIGQALAMTLKINLNHIRFDESINQYGVDSILAIELVNQLREQLEISLSPTDFMDGKSILQLSETLSVRFDS